MASWPVSSCGDILARPPAAFLDEFGLSPGDIDLLAGGPPCQPFSKSGQWVTGAPARMTDPRAQTLLAYLRMVEAALPSAMLLENVKGFAYGRGRTDGVHALDVLEHELRQINKRHGTRYVPHVFVVNAADYGVPQKRERVIVVAARDGAPFTKPPPTHGPDGTLTNRFTNTWDAIGDLDASSWPPSLAPTGSWADLLPTIPEGHNYLFHTSRGEGHPLFGWRRKYWSFMLKLAKNRPSWTIQASPGPATGPFHWRSRKLSIRELARLQSFPDNHEFVGSYQSCRRQIGNAVPVTLAEALGLSIRRQVFGDASADRTAASIIRQRDDCPDPEPATELPLRYLPLVGEHGEHPGPGAGPRASLAV